MKKLFVVIVCCLMVAQINARVGGRRWSRVAADPVSGPIPINTFYRAAEGDPKARAEIKKMISRWDKAFKKDSWLPLVVFVEFERRVEEEPKQMRIIRICKGCEDETGRNWGRFSEVAFSNPVKIMHDVRATFSAPAPGLATTIEYGGRVYNMAVSILCGNLVWFYGEPKAVRLPARTPEPGLPPRLPAAQPQAESPPHPTQSRFGLGVVAEYADYSKATADLSVGGLSGMGSWIAGLQFFVDEAPAESPVHFSGILTAGGTGTAGAEGAKRSYLRVDPQLRFGNHLWLNAGVAYTQGSGRSTVFINPTLTLQIPYATAEAAVFNSTPKGQDNPEPESKVNRARVGAKIDEVLGGLFENTHNLFITAGVGRRAEQHNYPDGSRREVTTANVIEGYLQVYKGLWEKQSFDQAHGHYRTDASSYVWLEGNYGMLRSKTFDPDGRLLTDLTAPAYNVVVRFGIRFNSFRGGRGLFTRD